MTQTELAQIIKQGPCEIKMASGKTWIVPHSEFALVGPLTIAILHRDENGENAIYHLSLRLIESVRNLSEANE